MRPPRTLVYVDGFNLYYGALKNTPFKWLNLYALSQSLLPKHTIIGIKYFTARVRARPNDPGQPARQDIYLRALRTLPNIDIIFGTFLSNEVLMPLANPASQGPTFVKVIKTEEKGSDVNIATHLVHDAHRSRFEVAAVITNDSDLCEPIRVVSTELQLPVGVLYPTQRVNRQLQHSSSFVKSVRTGVLRHSQFPALMSDQTGVFHKPASW